MVTWESHNLEQRTVLQSAQTRTRYEYEGTKQEIF